MAEFEPHLTIGLREAREILSSSVNQNWFITVKLREFVDNYEGI
jgi:hypothetical protein